MDVGAHRLQTATPVVKADEYFSILICEFCCISLESSASATLETIWGIYKKLPLRQLIHLNSTLITYLTDTTDSNTIDVANDLMIAICNNIHSRGLNSMHAAMNLVKGLESESTECRTACLGALNKLLPQHGIDDETTAIEDYLSHR